MGKKKFLKNLNLAIHTTRDAKKDDDVQWITKKGHHLAINGEGEIVAGGIPNTNIGKGTKLKGSSSKGETKGEKKKGKQKADESNVEDLLYKLKADEIYFELIPTLREMGNKKLGKGIDWNEDSRNYMVEQIMDDIEQWKYGTLKDVVNAYNKTFIKEEEGDSQSTIKSIESKIDKISSSGYEMSLEDIVDEIENKFTSKEISEEEKDKLMQKVGEKFEELEESDIDFFDAKSVKDALPRGTQMANYKYDPILCMNVPVTGTKAKDAATRTTDYRVEVEENLKSLIRNYEQGSAADDAKDYVYMLFDNSKYSPYDEKQWERCKNDAIKDMQDLAKDLKSAATQIVDRGTQKMVSAIRRMKHDD